MIRKVDEAGPLIRSECGGLFSNDESMRARAHPCIAPDGSCLVYDIDFAGPDLIKKLRQIMEPTTMRRVMLASIIILFQTTLMHSQAAQNGAVLNENLKILEPMLHKNWVGDMKSPDGQQTFRVSISCEPIWDGEVIKYSRSNPERKTYSEGYFYWDVNEKKIIFLSVSNRGGTLKADVSIEDGKISLKGSTTVQNRKFDFRNTFELTSDGKMVDRWFQNASGSWQPGHVIEFMKK